MKILLLGKNGQVGWQLQRALAPLGEIVALERKDAGGDLADPQGLAAAVRAAKPQVIVNAAAYTAVDKAESEPQLARLINTEAPAALAREAAASGALLVHYSTDYVFDGSGSAPWQESDATGPLNVYGATKLAGGKRLNDLVGLVQAYEATYMPIDGTLVDRIRSIVAGVEVDLDKPLPPELGDADAP